MVSPLFYKDGFGIKYPMNVDMTSNKEIKSKAPDYTDTTSLWNEKIYPRAWNPLLHE